MKDRGHNSKPNPQTPKHTPQAASVGPALAPIAQRSPGLDRVAVSAWEENPRRRGEREGARSPYQLCGSEAGMRGSWLGPHRSPRPRRAPPSSSSLNPTSSPAPSEEVGGSARPPAGESAPLATVHPTRVLLGTATSARCAPIASSLALTPQSLGRQGALP